VGNLFASIRFDVSEQITGNGKRDRSTAPVHGFPALPAQFFDSVLEYPRERCEAGRAGRALLTQYSPPMLFPHFVGDACLREPYQFSKRRIRPA